MKYLVQAGELYPHTCKYILLMKNQHNLRYSFFLYQFIQKQNATDVLNAKRKDLVRASLWGKYRVSGIS